MNPALFGLLVVALLLGAAGQLTMKYSLNTFKAKHGDEFEGPATLFRALFTWGVLAGLACYVLSTVLYIRLMWGIPLSLLYPMVALNYVFVTLLARLFLGEKCPSIRLVGLALIIAGVTVYAVWGQAPAEPPTAAAAALVE